MICGIAETDELIVELSDHQYSWMVARGGEHSPEYRHFPVTYVREGLPQPTICLADEILSREQAYSLAFNWLRRGWIPEGYELRRPYLQPGYEWPEE
ncbi:hypothetical protein D3230_09440 [Leucobacter chromiireducens subsp. solipictus]|uniref:Uncharacterized protein n=2 Tax=Leucobacter TaxID=55968 RepID=A0ABS1SG31_9MICO|nr:hypothetical protein [Leucobacter chromiireducens subsp. solipictus]